MLALDLLLNPGTYGGAAADKVYNFIGQPTPSSTLRRVASTALTAPDRLMIANRQNVRNGMTYDERVIRFDEMFTDPVLGSGDFSSWLAIKVPRGTSVVTTALVKNQIGRLIACWLASGNADKILNGEM